MRGNLIPRSWGLNMPRSLRRDLSDFGREFDAMFEDVFGASPRGEDSQPWWPSVEERTKDGQLILRCDLPGVDPKDVEVTLEGTTLTISGERKTEHEEKDGERHFSEVRYGRFERQLTGPEGLDPAKVRARYANGVLEVALPLAAWRTPKKVPVQIEGAGKAA